jgi:hypothetical protein
MLDVKTSQKLPRRAFLVRAGLGLVATVVAPSFAHAGDPRRKTAKPPMGQNGLQIDRVTAKDFAAYRGQRFHVYSDARQYVDVFLAGSQVYPWRTPRGWEFSLFFANPAGRRLEEQTYLIEHATLGRFDLHLIPRGPSLAPSRYEAVFT